jgi:hypothetical protein
MRKKNESAENGQNYSLTPFTFYLSPISPIFCMDQDSAQPRWRRLITL